MIAEITQLLTILSTMTPNQLEERLSLLGSRLVEDDWSGLLYGIEELAQNGRADLAEQLMAACLRVAQENENEWAFRAVTYFLGHVYYLQGQVERAIEAYQAVVDSGLEVGDEDGRFQVSLALSRISGMHMEQGHIPEAIEVTKQVLKLDEGLDWQIGLIGDRLELAGMYLVQEEFARVETTLQQALTEAQAVHDLFWIAMVYLRLAGLQEDLENPAAALEYYQTARDALDAIEEPEDEELYVKIYRELFVGLGTARQNLGEPDKAIAAFSSAARLANVFEDKRSQAVAITWLGHAQLDAGQPELASRSFSAAERLARLVNYTGWMGTIHFFHASAWQALECFDEAEDAAHQAIQHHRSTVGKNSPDEVGCLMLLGRIALERGSLEESIARYQQALGILQEIGVSQMHRLIYLRLGEAYWYHDQFSHAYEALRQALEVYESKRQTVSELWRRVDFAPSRDLVYEYLARTCLALGKVVEAFTAVEEGRMRVFREQLERQPITDEPVETLDWSDIKLLLCLEV